MSGDGLAALVGALALDAVLGEPPARAHPVVAMGSAIGRAVPPDPPGSGATTLARGAAVTAAGAVTCAALAAAAARLGHRGPAALRSATDALGLWPLLALRGLTDSAARVAAALDADDDPGARAGLRWLVGREVDDLDRPLLASAAIESLAENLADSVVAPLLYARLAGLPGAAVHRFANTADAVIGYRERFELGGRAAARLDDLLGLVPSRLAAVALVAVASAGQGSAAGAWRCLRRDGGRTHSPNAGRPMAAMAGALGVRLEKRGHHVINPAGRSADATQIRRAVVLVRVATVATLVALCAVPRPRGSRHVR